MVRRRPKVKQSEQDAMSRLLVVRSKWREQELPDEEVSTATNLLIEAGDHRVIYQLLVLLLEGVRGLCIRLCYTSN